MMYHKFIGDREVFSDGSKIEIDGVTYYNPTSEMMLANGWEPYTPPSPEPIVPQPQTAPNEWDIIQAVKRMLAQDCENLSDEDALAVAALFPTWSSKMGAEVTTGERLWDDGELWKVLQPHTVQANWRPKNSPSLFVRVTIEQWPAWKQPLGSTDAYRLNAQVSHNDKHWISEIDYNTYEPGVYGWREV